MCIYLLGACVCCILCGVYVNVFTVHVYVCINVCMYYMCVWIRVCVIYVYVYTCMCIRVCVYMYAYVLCMLGCMHKYVYFYAQVCMSIYIMCVWLHVTAIRTYSCDLNSIKEDSNLCRYGPDTLAI